MFLKTFLKTLFVDWDIDKFILTTESSNERDSRNDKTIKEIIK